MDAQRSKRPELLTSYDETSPFAEAYRILRNNLFQANGKSPWSVGITGVEPRHGCSTTAANLSLIVAETGSRVVLVDGDLYKPSLHMIFDLPNEIGLSTVLQGQATVDAALKTVTDPGLVRVLPAGPKVRNPAGLLRPPAVRAILDELRGRCDFLMVDLPSVSAVAYTSFLTSFLDGVLLVVRAGATPAGVERIMKRRLQGAKILGMVLNQVSVEGSEVSGYRHYTEVKG